MADTASPLQQLAALYGVQVAFHDAAGRLQQAGPESLLRVLQVLGAPVQSTADAGDALRQRRQASWQRGLGPVSVAWQGETATVLLRMPARLSSGVLSCRLQLDGGPALDLSYKLENLPVAEAVSVEGVAYVARGLALPADLPLGQHRLSVELEGHRLESLILSAPRRAFSSEGADARRTWGVFLPLYALHTQRSWGSGTFSDLRNLLGWVNRLGGGVVATLPLLAAFLDESFEPSPYSPVSRMFWNEFYLDVEAAPELPNCPAAQALLGSAEVREQLRLFRAAPLVDYRRQMALKRRVLTELACSFATRPTPARLAAHEQFLRAHPQVTDYAAFRAAGERLRTPWPQWPARLRDGALAEGDSDEEARRYHLYVQWLASEQMQTLAASARSSGPGLYLDMPLGVHGHGYDVWRERQAFAIGVSGGCPPDIVFPKGQNWGFPPLHPEGVREQGYRYVTAYVRHQMSFAGVLRIDHMPSFHRVFWVPEGMEAKDGVYVHYRSEELYALFTLESHRYKTLLVGEDLGTVPPEVPQAMERHDVQRMYVVQYELKADPSRALPPPPAASVASINTHDMPPFAAYWRGLDVRERLELGLLGTQHADKEQQDRQAMLDALVQFLRSQSNLGDAAEVWNILQGCLKYLAESPTRTVLVNLEDLWLETLSQNVPSTSQECPNWRRKARYSLEEMERLAPVIEALQEMNRLVRGR